MLGMKLRITILTFKESLKCLMQRETAVCENLDEPGNVRWTLSQGRLTITIPRLGFHACVTIKEEC